jgi:hypothetical protein
MILLARARSTARVAASWLVRDDSQREARREALLASLDGQGERSRARRRDESVLSVVNVITLM